MSVYICNSVTSVCLCVRTVLLDYLGGHAQQNGEQLNNLLKTLDGFYKNDAMIAAGVPMSNRSEFIGYFIIFQLGNKGEVSKYLQQLDDDVLNSPEVQFAIKIWCSLKNNNYAAFFRLLREANFLQACLMHRYVGEVRVAAMKKMVRGYFAGKNAEVYYPLTNLIRLLMFEDEEDALEFLQHCGLEVLHV